MSKEAEIKISLSLSEHNIAFLSVDHLTKLMKNCFFDSSVAQNISLERMNSTKIINNAVRKEQLNIVCEYLCKNKFSICIDESTDVNNLKNLYIVARVSIDCDVKDLFFGLINVTQCDTQSLYKEITNYFIKCQINYMDNMIGFTVDGANNMTGNLIIL